MSGADRSGAGTARSGSVRAVLFDLGGTLVDTLDPLAWTRTAETVGLSLEADHLAHAYREVERELEGGPGGGFEEFLRKVLERATGAPVPAATAARFLAEWNRVDRSLPIFSDVRRCLDELAADGLRLGVVSNSQSEALVRRRLADVDLAGRFEVVVSSGTEGVRKPDPEIFRRALSRMRLDAGAAVYVGDSPRTDALGARAAGLHGVWLNRYGWGFGDDPPEITSLTELPAYVRRLVGAPVK